MSCNQNDVQHDTFANSGELPYIYDELESMCLPKNKIGVKPTHGSMDPKKSYYIPRESYPLFIRQYCTSISRKYVLCITEIPDTPSPFRLDIDLKSSKEFLSSLSSPRHKHLYNQDDIIGLIEICQDEISKISHLEHVSASCRCVVLEKARMRKDEKKSEVSYKDGLHIHFPDFALDTWCFEVLRKRIETTLNSEKKFFKEAEEIILDQGLSSKPWLMYGSAKDLQSEPYKATRFFAQNCTEMTIETFFLPDLQHLNAQKIFAGKNNQDMWYFLPVFLSVKGKKPTKLTENFIKKKREISSRGKKVPRKRSEADIMKELVSIREGNFMNLLSQERAENYDKWMDVGWVLFNIAEGCEEGLDLWITFSQRSESFIEGECDRLWQNMVMGGKTFGSIWYMMEEDNPEALKAWNNIGIKDTLSQFMQNKPTEGRIAELVVQMYKNKFICANASKNIWYEFINHRWREADHAITLKIKIYKDVRQRFIDYRKKMTKKKKKEQDEDDKNTNEPENGGTKKKTKKKTVEDELANIASVISLLENPHTLKNVVEMCKLFMHDPEFLSKLDKNRYVIGCENGVLDLNTKQFREGRPDDYVSMSTKIYYKDYNGAEPEVNELEDVMHKIYPNSNVRQFMYDVWSMVLGGRNYRKIFLVSTGASNGGKSAIHSLFGETLGEYAAKSPPEMIQRGNKNSSGSARPDLARLKGKRANVFDEISDSRTLDIDAIKRETGNDVKWARGLWDGKGEDIKPMYVTFLQCNTPPKIPTTDEALWFRMMVVPMISKFLFTGYPESEEEQWERHIFPANVKFDERIPALAPVLLWKIFRNFSSKTNDTVNVPEEVIIETNYYRSSNDFYESFIIECMEKQPKENQHDDFFVSVNELFSEFKEWYHQNCSKGTITKTDFTREVNKRFGPATKNVWKGWRLKQITISTKSK